MKKSVKGTLLAILLGILIAVGINRLVDVGVQTYFTLKKVDELETTVKVQEKEIKELWDNIDALSEDYTTLWVNLYGEDSWHE